MITPDNVFIVQNVGMVDEPHAFEYVIVNMIRNILDVESVHFGTWEFDENWSNLICNYTSLSCILETTKPNLSLVGRFVCFFFELWFAYNSCKHPKEINSILFQIMCKNT